MAERIFWWVFVLASASAFIMGWEMVKDLVRSWRRGEFSERRKSGPSAGSKLADTNGDESYTLH